MRSVDADVAGEVTRETEETVTTVEAGEAAAVEAGEASPGGMKMERGTTRATARMVPNPRKPLLPQPQPQLQPLLTMGRHLCKTTAVATTPVTAAGGGGEKTSLFLFP